MADFLGAAVHLFPPRDGTQVKAGNRVVTFVNQDDCIEVRHHVYVRTSYDSVELSEGMSGPNRGQALSVGLPCTNSNASRPSVHDAPVLNNHGHSGEQGRRLGVASEPVYPHCPEKELFLIAWSALSPRWSCWSLRGWHAWLGVAGNRMTEEDTPNMRNTAEWC